MMLRRLAAVLFGRRARLRWVHLILGGALLMPYYLLAGVVVQVLDVPDRLGELLALPMALPLVAVTGLFPLVRTLEAVAARALLGLPATGTTTRWRAAAWYTVHLAVGGVVSGMTLAIPPFAVALLVMPFLSGPPRIGGVPWSYPTFGPWAPAIGVASLVALACTAALAGALMAGLAPALLGPSPAERVAELERRATQLAERNRLARELHDSVGHALSVVTIQAGAAQRVLSDDPAFARRALSAIEESARRALQDLDHVVGLLREEDTAKAPPPALGDLDRLLEQTRLAGVHVETTIAGDPALLPVVVSREAYRIVQEGLTNALRHAGPVPVRLRVDVRPELLELELTNPLGTARPGHAGGGRGLRGIGERVTVLHGQATAGADGDRWRLFVQLPLRAT